MCRAAPTGTSRRLQTLSLKRRQCRDKGAEKSTNSPIFYFEGYDGPVDHLIPAIVLAAGASTRMRRAKALLPAGDRTFVRRILDSLRDGGVGDVVVVVRPDDAAIEDQVAAAGFGRTVPNVRAEQGQLTSLLAGLEAVDAPAVAAVLVTLVDVPLITAATVRALCERVPLSPAQMVRAVYRGRHGHPVIFKRALFDPLRRADPAVGAKAVVRAASIEDVEVDDPGVVEDVDTPADYRRVIGPMR